MVPDRVPGTTTQNGDTETDPALPVNYHYTPWIGDVKRLSVTFSKNYEMGHLSIQVEASLLGVILSRTDMYSL